MTPADKLEPKHWAPEFRCPQCLIFAQQSWGHAYLYYPNGGRNEVSGFSFNQCLACSNFGLWKHHKLVYPRAATAALPSDDMPVDVKADYLEAREVQSISPRSAGALLRLALEKLLKHLGVTAGDINSGIGELVKMGLNPNVQKAMDTLRVKGNGMVHAGEIAAEQYPEDATMLFKLLNLIVEKMITEPKEIDSLYSSLPPSKLEGIERRDKLKG